MWGNHEILFLTRANASFVNHHNRLSYKCLEWNVFFKIRLKCIKGFCFYEHFLKTGVEIEKILNLSRLGALEWGSGRLKIKLHCCCCFFLFFFVCFFFGEAHVCKISLIFNRSLKQKRSLQHKNIGSYLTLRLFSLKAMFSFYQINDAECILTFYFKIE